MDSIDIKKAAAVWQRVQGGSAPPTPPAVGDDQALLALITEEWSDATTYLSLSRRFQGKESAILRQLAEQEQSHTACLKGIYTLITGTRPQLRTIPASKEPADIILRRCYGREMRSLAQYENRSTDPQYGPVFSRLAQQEREHCHMVLELLGKLRK